MKKIMPGHIWKADVEEILILIQCLNGYIHKYKLCQPFGTIKIIHAYILPLS